jgi:hypothetical protein
VPREIRLSVAALATAAVEEVLRKSLRDVSPSEVVLLFMVIL